MKVVAIVGRAGSGKSTCARALAERGWLVRSIAGPIKGIAAAIWFLSKEEVNGSLKDVGSPSPRSRMIFLGGLLRRQLGENVLVNGLVNGLIEQFKMFSDDARVVIDDVRYQHEVDRLREAFVGDVLVVKLSPDGLVPRVDSESSVDEVRADVRVTGSLENGEVKEKFLSLVGTWSE